VPRPRPKFGHAATAILHAADRDIVLLGCYHPSQQNTFTGKLTTAMLDDIFVTAKRFAATTGGERSAHGRR